MRLQVLAMVILVFQAASAAASEVIEERDDWAAFFSDAGVTGTIAVIDEREEGAVFVHNADRAKQQFLPASTFKIAHTLFALDAGVIEDEFQTFPWDGIERWYDAWNADQDLRSAMRHSALWLYQEFARDIGAEQERKYLQRAAYGNATIGSKVDEFWIDDTLRISALEQVAFLRNLYHNELPFSVADQRLVKALMINEAGLNWVLRAKTGWGVRSSGNLGWWVGWVETPRGAVFFALNIEMPQGGDDAFKRKGITRAILQDLNALDQEKTN